MRYAHPGSEGAVVSFKSRYGNYINGQFVEPAGGQYFTNLPRSTVSPSPSSRAPTPPTSKARTPPMPPPMPGQDQRPARSLILLQIADRIEQNHGDARHHRDLDNGKAVRETLNADIPLAADHFRYFAGCIRAREGTSAEIDEHTAAYHFHEPLGVVGQIIPWNFPILMAARSSPRRWPPATAWCSNRPSRPRWASTCCSNASATCCPGRAQRGARLRPGSRRSTGL